MSPDLRERLIALLHRLESSCPVCELGLMEVGYETGRETHRKYEHESYCELAACLRQLRAERPPVGSESTVVVINEAEPLPDLDRLPAPIFRAK